MNANPYIWRNWLRLFDNLTEGFIIAIQISLLVVSIYYIFLAVTGLFRRREPARREPEKRFAVVVAAHNEERVISPLLENLKDLDYPKALYDIFVVADNCTDSTAAIARAGGVRVHERFDEKRGKGYALEWMFNRLFSLTDSVPYDAVIIFDADNLVKRDYLSVMNSKLLAGCQIVQGYVDAKNPYDTWVTNTFAISFWIVNRMMQLARSNLRLSNILAGTGMCISTEILRQIGWGAHSLSEDLEFTVQALLCGVKTDWAHDAVVYDEKPLGFKQSCRQRKRWAQGHIDVSRKYTLPLIQKAIMERKWRYLDTALHLFQPFLTLMGTFVAFIQLLGADFAQTAFTDLLPVYLWPVIMVVTFLLTLLSFMLDKIPIRAFLGLICYPLFMYAWIPILIVGFIHHKRRDWYHTEHSRSLSYRDVAREEKA